MKKGFCFLALPVFALCSGNASALVGINTLVVDTQECHQYQSQIEHYFSQEIDQYNSAQGLTEDQVKLKTQERFLPVFHSAIARYLSFQVRTARGTLNGFPVFNTLGIDRNGFPHNVTVDASSVRRPQGFLARLREYYRDSWIQNLSDHPVGDHFEVHPGSELLSDRSLSQLMNRRFLAVQMQTELEHLVDSANNGRDVACPTFPPDHPGTLAPFYDDSHSEWYCAESRDSQTRINPLYSIRYSSDPGSFAYDGYPSFQIRYQGPDFNSLASQLLSDQDISNYIAKVNNPQLTWPMEPEELNNSQEEYQIDSSLVPNTAPYRQIGVQLQPINRPDYVVEFGRSSINSRIRGLTYEQAGEAYLMATLRRLHPQCWREIPQTHAATH